MFIVSYESETTKKNNHTINIFGIPLKKRPGFSFQSFWRQKNRQKVFPLQSLMQIVLNKKIQNQSHFNNRRDRKNEYFAGL